MNDRRRESYGQGKLTFVDRLGVWLSSRAIARELPETNLEVLELGCGFRATHLVALSPRLKRGVGVDFRIAPELVGRAENLTFHEGSIEAALGELSRQTFDAVLLISVLEHLNQPLHVLEVIRGLLKRCGVLLINVPTWSGKKFLEFSAFRLGLSSRLEMDDHKMYYDKRDLWPLLVRAGFRPSLIKLRYHKFGLNLFAVARREDA